MDELFRRAEKQEGYTLTIDLPAQTVSDGSGLNYTFRIGDFRKHILLEGLDEIGITLKHGPEIDAYERAHHPGAALYSPVDAKYAPNA